MSIQLHEMAVRDGAYVRDFQLSAPEVAGLVKSAAKAGIPLIEVGHGVGLGGAKAFPAGASDEEYLTAAAEVRGESKLAVLMLPRFSDSSDVELANRFRDHLHFVRVGPDADKIDTAWPLVDQLFEADLPVALNLLKAYLVRPNDLVTPLKQAYKRGIRTAYIVDSAGHLTPADVQAYVQVVLDEGLVCGFHGHDNLRLSIANSLSAVDAGATYLDSSLAGVGRSAGNTPTEVLATLLVTRGQLDLDLGAVFDAAEYTAKVYERPVPISSTDILFGAAGLHSGFLTKLESLAERVGKSLRQVLVLAATHGWSTMEAVEAGIGTVNQDGASQ